jgi:hypothetical protein
VVGPFKFLTYSYFMIFSYKLFPTKNHRQINKYRIHVPSTLSSTHYTNIRTPEFPDSQQQPTRTPYHKLHVSIFPRAPHTLPQTTTRLCNHQTIHQTRFTHLSTYPLNLPPTPRLERPHHLLQRTLVPRTSKQTSRHDLENTIIQN